MSTREILSWFSITFLVGVVIGYQFRDVQKVNEVQSDCHFHNSRLDEEAFRVPSLPPKSSTINSKLNEAKENACHDCPENLED